MKQHPVCIGTLERLLFLCLYVQNRDEGTSVLICFILEDETQRVRSLSQSPKEREESHLGPDGENNGTDTRKEQLKRLEGGAADQNPDRGQTLVSVY